MADEPFDAYEWLCGLFDDEPPMVESNIIAPSHDIWVEIMFADFGAIWSLACSCAVLHRRMESVKERLVQRHTVKTERAVDCWHRLTTSRLPNGKFHGLTTCKSQCRNFNTHHVYEIEYRNHVPVTAHGGELRDGKVVRDTEYVDGITYYFDNSDDVGSFDACITLPMRLEWHERYIHVSIVEHSNGSLNIAYNSISILNIPTHTVHDITSLRELWKSYGDDIILEIEMTHRTNCKIISPRMCFEPLVRVVLPGLHYMLHTIESSYSADSDPDSHDEWYYDRGQDDIFIDEVDYIRKHAR